MTHCDFGRRLPINIAKTLLLVSAGSSRGNIYITPHITYHLMYVSTLISAASNICDRTMNTVQSPPSVHGPPILRLTPALRRRIYSHFHYALGRIPITFDIHGLNSRRRRTFPFHALLFTCRTIYDEVSEVLYSTNYFEVKYEDPKSLQRIRNLSDKSLASLTGLKFILKEVPCSRSRCIRGISEAKASPSTHQPGHMAWHDQALRPSDPSADNLLIDWRLTALYIGSRVSPEKLNMSLVCDLDPQDPQVSSAARLAVLPFNNLAPLKNCHIRLCRTPNRGLEEIARNAVLRAREIISHDEPAYTLSNTTAGSGSMLLRLPREIRFRILEYTDLITPWKEVRWSRQHRGYQPSIVSCHWKDCPSELHHGCQFRKCWPGFWPHEYTLNPRPPVGCFCRVRHAAFSFSCRCWSPPTDLFLVCRTLCEDARVIFFSGNRFVVHDYNPCAPWSEYGLGPYPNERLAVSEFLTEIVPAACLAEIRSLEVTFPPYNHDAWPQDGCRALSDWGEMVRVIKQKMNLDGLTLRLTMHHARERGEIGHLQDMTEPQALEILRAYTRILGPLAGLGEEGLKGFYAYVILPGKWTLWARDGPGYWGLILQKEQGLKERAELLVMGSRYGEQPRDEFYRSGEPVNSVWQKKYIRR